MGRYQLSTLENLPLITDWDSDGESEGQQRFPEVHTQMETTAHNKNLTAQNGEEHKAVWKTSMFKSATSAKQCVSVSKDSNKILKDTYSRKENLKTLGSYLVHAENNYLNPSKKRIGLTFQSNIPENQRFKNEEKSAKWHQLERASFEQLTLQQNHSVFNGGRITECSESEKKFNQGSDVNKHLRTHFPKDHYECNKCGEVFYQSSKLIIHKSTHMGENPYNICGRAFNQFSNIDDHQRIHMGKKSYRSDKPGSMFNHQD
ncbi:zinc finger protein 519-like [Panthera pardus]|uniref:Zinc finger protein 519-like n=1 Tax=Panthera pardus TaxID=9691 RepID=A0A9W2VUN1_PANPR|nr:zinc finger protein 519-like [Panthera pardus]